MNHETIQLKIENGVAWLTLNRPEALNAISVKMLSEITEALLQLKDDDAARVLVFTGAGRAFCAGADLKGDANETERAKPGASFLEIIQEALIKIRAFPKPVIAALNGITMGGGLELAMSCDIILAAEDAKIADAHANVGVIPGAGGCAVLPRLISPAYAKYLVFSGEVVTGAELHRLGMVAKVFPKDELLAGTKALAERIAEKSPLALRHMKRIIDQGLEQANVATALSMELIANASYRHTHDYKEGITAFGEKRKPNFKGR